jgi:hypothetical protein
MLAISLDLRFITLLGNSTSFSSDVVYVKEMVAVNFTCSSTTVLLDKVVDFFLCMYFDEPWNFHHVFVMMGYTTPEFTSRNKKVNGDRLM